MPKETSITFRITEEQKKELKKQATIHGASVSQYSRGKLFDDLPGDSSVNIRDLKSVLLDTQRSINDIAHACSSSGTFSQSDYLKVMDFLKKIDEEYYDLIREIRRSNDIDYQKAINAGRQKEGGEVNGDYEIDEN